MQTEKVYSEERHILSLRSESAGEYSLPDYNTDVKKLLLVRPAVIPSGKFLGEDCVEFSGVVSYDVVYLDSENNVTHAEFSTDYDIAVRTPGEGYLDSHIETAVSGYSLRLAGPRRFSVKCSLESDVHISERGSLEVAGDAFESYEPEIMTRTVSVMGTGFVHGAEREYADEVLAAEGAILDEVDVLMTDASVCLDGVTVSDGTAHLKGNICITMLCMTADGGVTRTVKQLAYNESLELPQLPDGAELVPSVDILSVKPNVNPTDTGVSVTVSVICEPHLILCFNEPLELIEDGFVKERGCSVRHGDFSYSTLLGRETDDYLFEARSALSDAAGEGIDGVDALISQPHIDTVTAEGARVRICGEVRVSAMAYQLTEENEKSYLPLKFSVPFERYVNHSCQICDNMSIKAKISMTDERAECDADSVYVSAQAHLELMLIGEQRTGCLTSCYLTDEEYSHEGSTVTVYYPSADETLFSVAKRFHTSVHAIARDNALSESVFSSLGEPLRALGTKKLIVK